MAVYAYVVILVVWEPVGNLEHLNLIGQVLDICFVLRYTAET